MRKLDLWRPIDLIGCHLLGPSFVGGFSISEVLHAGAELKKRGYKVTYNLLGEHVKDPRIISKAVETTVELLERMDKNNRGNISLKPTLYGLEISREEFYKSAKTIIDKAKETSAEIEFDAEAYRFIPNTFSVFSEFASRLHYRGFVRQAVQAHLTDIFALMDEYELWNKKLRVVEGSQVYPELSGVVSKNKDEVFVRYCSIIRRNHAEGQVPYVATVCDRKKVNAAKKILPSPYMLEFQMLYNSLPFGLFGGKIARDLIVGDGIFYKEEPKEGFDKEHEKKFLMHIEWPVRIYIPFVADWCHDAWIDYGLRRAAMMRRLLWRDLDPRIGKMLTLYGETCWKWH